MDEQMREPNRGRLWGIVIAAGLIAAVSGAAFWLQIESGGGMGWIGYVIVATLTVIIYAICFYFAVITFENTLEGYIVSDTFKRKNKWIDVETETRSSDDAKIDAWVKHYVFARQFFAIGILPLLACIYLFWFA